MKCFILLAVFLILNVSISYSITCEEAKTLLNIEYEGNCCDLQQINCDENNEEILSIESLIEEDYEEDLKKLYRRKGGGGHGGGGRGSSGGKSSGSKSSGSKSSGSKSSGSKGNASNGKVNSGYGTNYYPYYGGYYGYRGTHRSSNCGIYDESRKNDQKYNDEYFKKCNGAFTLKSTLYLWVIGIVLLVQLF
ncbi:hypothetical protein H8356DRAFT_1659419 [Neocallimastix lanati (nom. inval.)]|jgi:hypothetical protein|nr:hypothetical protein H8356DRAFT_1659419 [Neocallimastix sp. JGI-2020a]